MIFHVYKQLETQKKSTARGEVLPERLGTSSPTGIEFGPLGRSAEVPGGVPRPPELSWKERVALDIMRIG